MIKNKSTEGIKRALLQFHRDRGYQIIESFPLVSNDSTVLFVNATITPLKGIFIDDSASPMNFAIVQKCFRLGGSSDIELIGKNPNFCSYFEMFGSGTFNVSCSSAISYLLSLLKSLNLDSGREYFVIPPEFGFEQALKENGVNRSNIFILNQNQRFWQEWKFGKSGPVGKGLTVVYSTGNKKPSTIDQMENDSENFLELLNLIYIFGKDNGGTIAPVSYPGFELGVGVGRIATILQNCSGYEIDTISPLIETVRDYFRKQGYETKEDAIRICVDHLRSACILLEEGLTPDKKGSGYVLRKLIRRLIENIWQITSKPMHTSELANVFCQKMIEVGYFAPRPNNTIVAPIEEEEHLLLKILDGAKKLLEKNPGLSLKTLRDTYGISPIMLSLSKKTKGEET